MANIPYNQIMASRPFRVLVGDRKKEFTIHADLLSNMSKPLEALVNNKMKESNEGVAEWPEVDEETFVRFSQFAYTGNYDQRIPELLPLAKDATKILSPGPGVASKNSWNFGSEDEPVEEDELYSHSTQYYNKRTSSSKRPKKQTPDDCFPYPGRLWDQFKSLQYEIPESPKEGAKLPPASYSEVFLSHARLYVLADYYDIQKLAKLSLRKLHRMLVDYQLVKDELLSARIDNIIPLIEYSFQNTADIGANKDELRLLLTKYIGCKAEMLWSSVSFQKLLAEYGELSAAVIGQMIQRLDQ
ncbi:hypothetical protein F4810DRAFT_707847 [Camillea tinctor]|nr:hypothetical protein F4810DRAFT_707847 [Camillea tinctor]